MSRKSKNPEISAVQLKATSMEEKETKTVYRRERNDEALTIAGQVAGVTVYCRNYKFRNAAEHFPHEPLMRTVDKFFQVAKGGPLYVDEPIDQQEAKLCERKAKALGKEGLRYVYITKDMTFEEAAAQLDSTRGVA